MATNNALNVQGPTALFYAYNDANQSVNAGETKTIIFNTVKYDTTSSYDNATNIYTVSIAGYYNFNIYAYYTLSQNGIITINLVTTGGTYEAAYINGSLGDTVSPSARITCFMAVGDTAYMQMYNNTTGITQIISRNNQPSFSGSLVFAV